MQSLWCVSIPSRPPYSSHPTSYSYPTSLSIVLSPTMTMCRLQSPTRISTPHPLLGHHPRSLGVKVLTLALSQRLSRCRVDDELTQFRYLFHDAHVESRRFVACQPACTTTTLSIFEEDEDAPEDNNRCQSPTSMTRSTSTSATQPHVLARPSPSHTPTGSDQPSKSTSTNRY